jgi:hypothetical protein
MMKENNKQILHNYEGKPASKQEETRVHLHGENADTCWCNPRVLEWKEAKFVHKDAEGNVHTFTKMTWVLVQGQPYGIDV